ncbi:TonB-dependent receptor [Aquisalimonas lutea]|uniref:TonB-dependent receptor domain-containing protein n=1 Tax=Aquisalimonas lutea TaxID=1327750 RepID=UPI0025B2DB73|nr:TonB-dependent receptor [Aquisalimonas lutea]MDN3518856.1 TonB-dependent receptor [Aquisalimonas lutea]
MKTRDDESVPATRARPGRNRCGRTAGRTLGGVILLGLSPLAAAQDHPVETLKTIDVWSAQVSSDSTYLGEGDITLEQPDHLSDLLRDQPGVEVGGTHSTNQRINIRGLDDTDLEVTIDGARQNAFMYHHMGNLLINPDILKSAELRVGRNSVARGGLGGSTAFETKDPDDLLRPGQSAGARVSGSYFTNDERRGSVTGYGRVGGGVDLMGYAYYTDRDNPEDGSGTRNIGNDGEIANGLVKGGWNLTEIDRLELSYDRYRDEGDYTYRPDVGRATNESIPNSDLEYPTEYARDTWSLNYERSPADGTAIDATAYYNDLTLERDETRVGRPVVQGEVANRGARARLRTAADGPFVAHRLTYGVEVFRQEATYSEDGQELTEERSDEYAAYLEDRLAFGDRFALTPGVRYDRYEADSQTTEDTFDAWSAALAGEFAVSDSLMLHASATELFKGPELAETFTNEPGAFLPNEDIKPETGRNDELGARFSREDLLGADSFAAGFTVFRTRIDDRIESERVGGSTRLVNAGTLEIEGYEANVKYTVGSTSLTLTHSAQESEFRDTGEPLDREIGDTYAVTLDHYIRSLDLALNWTSRYVAEEDNVPSGSDPKPSYDVHDVSVQWLPQGRLEGLTVTFGVDNVFDEFYASHASRTGTTMHPVFGQLETTDYEPGRNVKLTAAYRF